MTKYIQIAFWISPNTRDFWLNGLRRKSILENDPKTKYVLGNWETLKFLENYIFVMPFSPNSFPAIGVLAGLIERRCWILDAGPMAGGQVTSIFAAIYLTW